MSSGVASVTSAETVYSPTRNAACFHVSCTSPPPANCGMEHSRVSSEIRQAGSSPVGCVPKLGRDTATLIPRASTALALRRVRVKTKGAPGGSFRSSTASVSSRSVRVDGPGGSTITVGQSLAGGASAPPACSTQAVLLMLVPGGRSGRKRIAKAKLWEAPAPTVPTGSVQWEPALPSGVQLHPGAEPAASKVESWGIVSCSTTPVASALPWL